MSSRIAFKVVSLLLAFVFVLSACAPQTVEVVKTVVVEKEGQQVVVTATPEPTADPASQPVTLRFTIWSSNEKHLAMLKEIGDAYTAKHPNVTVQFDSIPFDDYTSKVTVQLAGGNPPDAGWLMETAAASWEEAGVLSDLAATIKNYPDYDFADFSKSALGLWEKEDKLYGVPFSTSPVFLTYNIDLFTAAGVDTPDQWIQKGEWTWETFARISKEIKDKGPAGSYGFVGFDGKMFDTQPWSTMVPVMWAYGGDAWSADYKTCQLNGAESVKAVQLLHDMTFKDGSVVPPGENIAFASGTVGMTLHQLSRLTQLKEAPFKWGIAPLPAGPAGSKAVIGQAAIVVFDKSPNKEVAKDFVAFMTNKDGVTKMAAFFPPARASVLATDVLAQNNPNIDAAQVKSAVADGILNGRVLPTHPEFAKIDLAMRAEFDKMWVADANVQDALNKACEAAAPFFK